MKKAELKKLELENDKVLYAYWKAVARYAYLTAKIREQSQEKKQP